MCECILAILIKVCDANEFFFLYFALWLHKEAKSIPYMTADETLIKL
jgi:hypothetical protein